MGIPFRDQDHSSLKKVLGQLLAPVLKIKILGVKQTGAFPSCPSDQLLGSVSQVQGLALPLV